MAFELWRWSQPCSIRRKVVSVMGNSKGKGPEVGKSWCAGGTETRLRCKGLGGHEGRRARVTLLEGGVSEPIVGAQSGQARAAVGLARRQPVEGLCTVRCTPFGIDEAFQSYLYVWCPNQVANALKGKERCPLSPWWEVPCATLVPTKSDLLWEHTVLQAHLENSCSMPVTRAP